VASVRSCKKLPPCLTDPVPVGSKTDPLLAKAKPISNSGSASVITCLKGEKKPVETADEREEWNYVREKTGRTPRSVKKDVEEVLKMPEQTVFPSSP